MLERLTRAMDYFAHGGSPPEARLVENGQSSASMVIDRTRDRGPRAREGTRQYHPVASPTRLFAGTTALVLMAGLADGPFAQEMTGPTIEEAVAYIGQKLATCAVPQEIALEPPSTLVLRTPAFAGRTERIVDYPNKFHYLTVAGGWRISFDLAELSTNVEVSSSRAIDNTVFNYNDDVTVADLEASNVISRLYGGGNDVYAVVYRCLTRECVSVLDEPEPPKAESSPKSVPAPGETLEVYFNLLESFDLTFPTGSERTSPLGRYLHVCDPDAADRVQRALIHLIRESGGQEELF